MPQNNKKTIGADGLVTALKAKSRSRRQQASALAQVASTALSARNDLLPKLQLVNRPPTSLIRPARNVRKLDPLHLQDVMNGICAYGMCAPILIDGADHILDGVVRAEAAQRLRLPVVPCIVAQHLSESEAQVLRLAINRIGEKGIWSLPELKLTIEDAIAQGIAIETTGFTYDEIDQIIIDDDVDDDGSEVEPDPATEPRAKVGDVFRLGRHRLICGDATDLKVYASLLGDTAVRLVLTDQPYNVAIPGHVTKGAHEDFVMASGEMSDTQFTGFCSDWISAAAERLCDGGALATFIDWRSLHVVHRAASELGLEQLNLIVWGKKNAGMGSQYRSQHELLPLYKKGTAAHVNNVKLGKNGRWRSNLWIYPGASSLGSDARKGLEVHPTVKPVAMLEDALLDLTNRGDAVLDPFLGSGSTLIAAERTGRTCYAIELDPRYVDVAIKRYEACTGNNAVLGE